MTLISKEVTHFWVTFENSRCTTTGARAPILWKKANRGVGARKCESLSFAFVFSKAWTAKSQMRFILIGLWVDFSIIL